MSVVIDHEAVRRQLVEIEDADEERAHRGDRARRRAIQSLSVLGLLGSGARELYRREYLDALPTARYLLEDKRAETTLHPSRDRFDGNISQAALQAASVALSVIGGERRARQNPWMSIASTGLLALAAVSSGRQLLEDLEEGHLDVFTTVDAVSSAAALPLAVPEALRAIRGLLER